MGYHFGRIPHILCVPIVKQLYRYCEECQCTPRDKKWTTHVNILNIGPLRIKDVFNDKVVVVMNTVSLTHLGGVSICVFVRERERERESIMQEHFYFDSLGEPRSLSLLWFKLLSISIFTRSVHIPRTFLAL